jgi:hypothetical protein
MINVIVNAEEKEEELDYPCLMISEKQNIVLFTAYKKGRIVQSKKSFYDFNYYSEMWEMSEFRLFNGSVTFSNQLLKKEK